RRRWASPPRCRAGGRWSGWSRASARPHILQQRGEVRIEHVAPGGVVVHAGALDEPCPVPLCGKRTGHEAVVVDVLLARAAGQGHRHGAPRALAHGRAYEVHDAPVADEARLVTVEARDEEAARLQEEGGESARETGGGGGH